MSDSFTIKVGDRIESNQDGFVWVYRVISVADNGAVIAINESTAKERTFPGYGRILPPEIHWRAAAPHTHFIGPHEVVDWGADEHKDLNYARCSDGTTFVRQRHGDQEATAWELASV